MGKVCRVERCVISKGVFLRKRCVKLHTFNKYKVCNSKVCKFTHPMVCNRTHLRCVIVYTRCV